MTQALHSAGCHRVIGICDAPSSMKYRMAQYLGVTEEDKEDFEKFAEGLEDAVAFIRARLGQVEGRGNAAEEGPGKSFTDVNFDEF